MRTHSLLKNKKLLIITIVVGVLVTLAATIIISELVASTQESNRVSAFKAEQSQRLKDVVSKNDKINQDAAKAEEAQHEALQKQVESGAVTTKAVPSSCARLDNREAIVVQDRVNCSYKLKAIGSAKMAVVFVTDQNGTDFANDIAAYTAAQTSKDSLLYINEFLKREASRKNNPAMNIEMSFYGPFKQVSGISGHNDNLENLQEIIDAMQNTSLQNKVPERDFDMVHYVYLPKDAFRSFALPGKHRAFTNAYYFGTTGVFIHESLHLLGASDKYNNGDCATRGRGNPFDPNSGDTNLTDIMCSSYTDLDSLNINTITARELGWLN